MTAKRSAGFTLVEMLIVAAIVSFLFIGLVRLFQTTSWGFASMGAGNTLKSAGQEAVNRMGRRLAQNRRLFRAQDMAVGGYWINHLPNALTSDIPSWSELPDLNATGSLSPSGAGFSAGAVGNGLFFAALDSTPQDVVNVTDPANPGQPRSLRVDMVRFYYYYLADNPAVRIAGAPQKILREWRSRPYADYSRLMAISNIPIRNQVVDLVRARAPVAWDPSSTSGDTGFYTLLLGGGLQLDPAYRLEADPVTGGRPFVDVYPSAVGGAQTGVSPNSRGPSNTVLFDSATPVPQFADPSLSGFPAGFETQIVGPAMNRNVYVRLVLIAKGAFKGYVTNEQVMLRNVRDIW